MKKLYQSLGGLILLCIIGGVIFLFLLWSRTPDMLATQLTKRLKVGVEIGDLHLSYRDLTVDRFEIHNPKGFDLPKAFAVSKIVIQAPLTRFLKDHIEIDEINLNNVYIGLEFNSPKSTQGNWSTILANAKHARDTSQKSSSQKTVLIRRLFLTDIQVDLYYQSDGKVRKLKPIEQIELKNISSEGGDIGDQLMHTALGEAVKQVFVEENLKDLLDKIIPTPDNNPAQPLLSPFKGLFK